MEGEGERHIPLAIIVVSYRSDGRTIEFVKNEAPKISLPHIVVIVNNGAIGESDETLSEKLNAPVVTWNSVGVPKSDVYVISNSENSGFAKGNNMGFKFAMSNFSPEYILFSNNDIRIMGGDCVSQLVEKLERTPTVGMIGPAVVGLNGEAQSPEPYRSFWERYVTMYLATPFMSSEKKRRIYRLDYSQTAREGFHYKVMGSFFLMRSAHYSACGMMDEGTFLYAEEIILAERLKRLGLGVYYYPQVGVVHDHGATIGNYFKSRQVAEMVFKSECYYYKKYKGVEWWKIFFGHIIYQMYLLIKMR